MGSEMCIRDRYTVWSSASQFDGEQVSLEVSTSELGTPIVSSNSGIEISLGGIPGCEETPPKVAPSEDFAAMDGVGLPPLAAMPPPEVERADRLVTGSPDGPFAAAVDGAVPPAPEPAPVGALNIACDEFEAMIGAVPFVVAGNIGDPALEV